MKKIPLPALILLSVSLSMFSCASPGDAQAAEIFFKDFLVSVRDNDMDTIVAAAPFLSDVQGDELEAGLDVFRQISVSDIRLTAKRVGKNLFALNVYFPGDTGTTETQTITCQKTGPSSWVILPTWQRTVLIDKIELDNN